MLSSRGQLNESRRSSDKKLVELVTSYSTNQASSRPRAKSSAKIITQNSTIRPEYFPPRRPDTSQKNTRNPDRAKRRKTQSNRDSKIGRGGSMQIMDLENPKDRSPTRIQFPSNQESRLSADQEALFWQTNSSRFNFE